MATIKDIARIVGCSHPLVSQVLRGDPACRASRETRMEILRVSCSLNYRPNRLARRLRGSGSGVIFILSRCCPPPECQLLMSVISEKLGELGYQVFQAQTASDSDTRNLVGDFVELGADGIVSCYTHYIPPEDAGIPTVTISDYDSVPHDLGMDMASAGNMLTAHLLEHGLRRIAFVGIGAWGFKEFQGGYEEAMNAHGMKKNWTFDMQYDIRGLQKLLKALKEEHLDAFVCQNDYLAAKLMAALAENGIRVPDKVAVTGNNGMAFGDFCTPQLTTTLYPYRELAEEAASLIHARICKTPDTSSLPKMFKPTLYLGGSCGCTPHPREKLFLLQPTPILQENLRRESLLMLE